MLIQYDLMRNFYGHVKNIYEDLIERDYGSFVLAMSGLEGNIFDREKKSEEKKKLKKPWKGNLNKQKKKKGGRKGQR